MNTALYPIFAALLFGLSAPAAKALIGAVDPWLLAGLLYLGSGLGLATLRIAHGTAKHEAPLSRADLHPLAGAILFGGILGPALLMIGLAKTGASTASLLLTVEGVATAFIAWFVFKENFDRRIALGMGLIIGGTMLLAWQGELRLSAMSGPLAIIGACIAWGIDNNLTRKISLADPAQIAMFKGLVAGAVNLIAALTAGAHTPPLEIVALAGTIGFLGYGVSLVLFVLGLRHLGTARTGAYFSTAPFLGAIGAVALLGEPVTLQLILSGSLMAAGVWLHLTERHAHEHDHEAVAHSHRHLHDLHHQHAHSASDPAGEPHSHRHAHVRLRHSHAHAPDSHHRHTH